MRHRASGIIGLTICILVAGCGSGDEFTVPGRRARDGPTPATGAAYTPASATSTVSGRILFEGPAPEMPFLDMGSDRYCQRAGLGLMSEEVRITEEGMLANVIVYVQSGHDPSLTYPAPSEPAVLDQDRCVYSPRVLTLMAGQELLIRNSDATLHNVHGQDGSETLFNFAQTSGPREDIEVFTEPRMPVHIGCGLHRWMDTYLGVFDHPFHTTSGTGGRYTLPLPPGTYQIAAWHERYGESIQTVEVAAGESAVMDFTFGEPE